MAVKPKSLSNFLRSLADYLDQRNPPITSFKKIVITAESGTAGGKDYDYRAVIKGKDITKEGQGDFALCGIHLNVCDWIPCPSQNATAKK